MTAHDLRYQPDEAPPTPLAMGLGLQQALLSVSGIVLTPVIVIRAAGLDAGDYLSWAVFAALLVSGLTTILQARRIGPLGAGYPLLMGTSGAFIAVCVTALVEGGPGLMATLVAASSLLQFAFASRLSMFRRVITPTVAGTVIMLVTVTVMPILFGMLEDVPQDAPAVAAPACAAITLLLIVALALRARGMLRLWVPLIGLVVGCAAATAFGIYDSERVAQAAWLGVPDLAWPGLNLDFGIQFWALLPAFAFVTIVGAIETTGDAVAIQRVAWRQPRAADYRTVQGALGADGVGNLLSGLAGTVPNTTYSSSISITELTGVAARQIGVWIGVTFFAVAFCPKFAALLLAVPSPVVAAYVTVLLAMLFVLGMRMVVQDGLDFRKSLVVGISFWVGAGFQSEAIFADRLGAMASTLLGNGMTSGALAAIVISLFVELTRPRRQTVRLALDADAFARLNDFLDGFTRKHRLPEAMALRIAAAGEETLHCLQEGRQDGQPPRQLRVAARKEDDTVELEFLAAPGGGNIEDQIVLLADRSPADDISEISLRLLRHYAAEVRHQKYFDTDVITLCMPVDHGAATAAALA